MTRNLDFIESLQRHFLTDAALPGVTVLVGQYSQIPEYPAIRLSLRREERGDILRRSDISNKKTAYVYVEVWQHSGDPDGLINHKALADFEDRVLVSLRVWAQYPPMPITGTTQFSPVIVEIVPGGDQSRPAIGSRITIKIDYL